MRVTHAKTSLLACTGVGMVSWQSLLQLMLVWLSLQLPGVLQPGSSMAQVLNVAGIANAR
jgi:hypothetical protein